MTQVKVENALKKHLSDADLGYPVGWPNQRLPSKGFPYLIVEDISGDSIRLGLEADGLHFYNGVFQVSVMIGQYKSTRTANAIVDQVKAAFPAGLRIDLNPGRIDILRNPVKQTGYPDDAAWRTPISIYYRAKF
jgi:hypothetical protein